VCKGKKIACVTVNLEAFKNLAKKVAIVKTMVKRHNGKLSMKKQGKECKSVTRLRNVKSNSGSDFAVKYTMKGQGRWTRWRWRQER
jgi:hypothetical protein